MAKCNHLTSLPFKGLSVNVTKQFENYEATRPSYTRPGRGLDISAS